MNRRGFIRRGIVASTGVISAASAILPQAPLALQELNLPLRLNSNENPLGLSPAARQTIRSNLPRAHRYPFPYVGELIEALALHHGIDRECIVLGAGSSEVIQMAVQTFYDSESLLISSIPTFEAAENVARSMSIQIHRVPLTSDHLHDLEALRIQSEHHRGPVLIYLCNPNNPTATVAPTREIERWISAAPNHVCFLIDEAYHEYVDDPDYYSLIPQAEIRRNLIVTRTFSKIYALAGLRVGYGVAHPTLRDRLASFASPANVNILSIFAALASLRDRAFVRRGQEINSKAKEILYSSLRKLEIPFLRSQTNFVMFHVPGALKEFISRMEEAGITTGRPFPPLSHHCRISIGLPEEMEYVTKVLTSFREKGWI